MSVQWLEMSFYHGLSSVRREQLSSAATKIEFEVDDRLLAAAGGDVGILMLGLPCFLQLNSSPARYRCWRVN